MQVQVAGGTGKPAYGNPPYGNLFHQLLLVGIQRIQPVNLVVLGLVGGRIAQHKQWAELDQRIQCFAAFHFLGFVQNEDGPVGADHIDRPAGLEAVQLLVDTKVILEFAFARCIECLDVDHHHIDTGIRRKTFQLVQLLRVVDEEPCSLAVGLLKMLCRDLQRLGHPLADGNAGHHDDELGPAVCPVQLENRLDVAVGLAGTGFHLDVEIDRRHPGFYDLVGQRQALGFLYLANVAFELHLAQCDVGVLEPVCAKQVCHGKPGHTRVIAVPAGFQAGHGLPFKTAYHGIDRGGLIGLRLELQLHHAALRCT